MPKKIAYLFLICLLGISLLALSVNAQSASTCKNPNGGDYCGDKSKVSDCYCESKCETYGDCCEDYQEVCSTPTTNPTCTDSDEGQNYYVAGYVKSDQGGYGDSPYGSGTAQDFCWYDNGYTGEVVEQYCENFIWKNVKYNCPNGCNDGACIRLNCGNGKCELEEMNLFTVREENPVISIDINGKIYEIKLLGMDADTAQFNVNGQTTSKLKVGDEETIADGSVFKVTYIAYFDYPGGQSHFVNFSIDTCPQDCESPSNGMPPQPPFDLVIDSIVDTDHGKIARLTWSNVNGEKFYIYKNKNDGEFVLLTSTSKKVYKDEVGGDIKYGYYVTAVNEFGESKPSNTVYIYPDGGIGTKVKEDVKCVFLSSTKTQECYSEKGKCKGVESCVVFNVVGVKGEKVTWKSTCGGYAYTTMDGQNEDAIFYCGTDTGEDVKETVKCVMWGATSPQECYSEKGSCKGEVQKDYTGRTYVSCGVDVSGKKGEQVTWKSTCGGYAYTTMDGQNDVAEFKCTQDIKEQVKCIFQNSGNFETCYSEKGSCKGAGVCIVNIEGKKGEEVVWKSSCGGYAYTFIDGVNEHAYFQCGQTSPSNGMSPSGTVQSTGNPTYVTLKWPAFADATHYSVRLDDGTSERIDDSRFETCPNSPHYYCENGVKDTFIDGVPVKPGRKYRFWVDPIIPGKEYFNINTVFEVS